MEGIRTLKPEVKYFIDTYLAHQKDLDCATCRLTSEAKAEALHYLEDYGFPSLHSEDYRHIDMVSLLGKQWNISSEGELKTETKNRFATLDGYQIARINGHCPDDAQLESLCESLPSGCYVGSLNSFLSSDAPEKQKKRVADVYAKHAAPDNDAMVALNTLFAIDALLVFVPEGTCIDKILHLEHIIAANSLQMIVDRVVIVVEKNAQLEILLSDTNPSSWDNESLYLSVVEVDLGPSALATIYLSEETSKKHNKLASYFIRQQAYSKAAMHTVVLHNGVTRNNVWSRFLGEHASLTLNGMAIVDEERLIDTFTRVEHVKPHCYTNERYKHVALGRSTASFTGRIFVAQGAVKTEAYQQDRNLLLSPDAYIYAKPHLEIYADDVQCSHGMTTGQLDAEVLFYMQQRGIPLEVAEKILSMAFTEDIIAAIPNEPLRRLFSEAVASYYFRDM